MERVGLEDITHEEEELRLEEKELHLEEEERRRVQEALCELKPEDAEAERETMNAEGEWREARVLASGKKLFMSTPNHEVTYNRLKESRCPTQTLNSISWEETYDLEAEKGTHIGVRG